ncbi:MAG: hypothetical protein AAF465_08670 [Pseudomonadota bacterium]
MSDDVTIPIEVLNPDVEHSFQRLLRGITPVHFDDALTIDVSTTLTDGAYVVTHDNQDHGFYHLSVYSVPAWNSLQSTIANRWPDDHERRILELSRVNANQEDAWVENGKLTGVTPSQLDYARIVGEAVLVGQGDCLLLMNPDSLRASMADGFEHDFSAVWPL